MKPSEIARQLGKLAKGKRKTMTDAALEQRQNAANASGIARAKKKAKNKLKKDLLNGTALAKVPRNERSKQNRRKHLGAKQAA